MAEKNASELQRAAIQKGIGIVAGALAGIFFLIFLGARVILPAYTAYVMDHMDSVYLSVRAMSNKIPPASSIRMASVMDMAAPGPAGEVPVRLYTPAEIRPDAPLLIYMHGGGYVLGGLPMADKTVRSLAKAGKCAAISIDYRLAPEHPYPAGLQDCYAVISWARSKAAELGAPSGKIVLAGDSAGANFAAVLSQMCRDLGGPSISGQMLFSPAVGGIDESTGKPYASRAANAKKSILTAKSLVSFGRMYLGDPERYADDPYVNPIRAASLAGLPPALIITCGKDPLREEGQAYARKLAAAGVAVSLKDFPGRNHAYTGKEVIGLAAKFLLSVR